MHYMLLVHADPHGWDALDDEGVAEAIAARARVIEQLRQAGRLIACSPLTAPDKAREIRVRDGAVDVRAMAVTDAPIAGFYLIEAADQADAEHWAALVPDSIDAHMTVRELMPLPGIPAVVPPPADSD